MKKLYSSLSLAFIFTTLLSYTTLAQNAWINEIHYSDSGTDTNEFVEVVIQDALSFTLSDFAVILYNGNNGESYDTKTLDEFTEGATVNDFKLFFFMYPTNGIQNGESDGLVLAYKDVVIPGQFLSYEGTFTAIGGPADGMTSVDIGVSEGGEPDGSSLQLSGSGSNYAAFAWQPPASETHGQLNNDQELLPVGIEVPNELEYVLYPNPNHGNFILVNPLGKSAKVIIYSVTGQKISEYQLIPGENKLSPDLEKGVYFLVLSDAKMNFLNNRRVVVY